MTKTGRNDPCHCGSGKKYKKCCEEKDQQAAMNNSVVDFTSNAQTLHDAEDDEAFELAGDDDDDLLDVSHLSPDDQYTVKTWWHLFDQMKSVDERRMHLETIFKHHPHLVEHLGIDVDAVFDMGSEYLKEYRAAEFIAFLMDFRNRFPAAYALSGAYYDQYIIAWLAAEGRSSEVKNYIDYFTDDEDTEPALWAVNILTAANMSQQALEITGNANLLEGKALDMILYHFIPSLKDFSAGSVDEFIKNLQHNPLAVSNSYVSFWREKLTAMSKSYTPWPDKAPSKKDDMLEILFEPVSQFVRYLHDELNLTWFSAQFYADNTGHYLQTYHERKKKPVPRLFHFPSQDDIEKHLEAIAIDYIGYADTTKYYTTLNGLYYFAAYLNKTGNFTEQETRTLQNHCIEIYNKNHTREKDFSYDALFFSKFPVWK